MRPKCESLGPLARSWADRTRHARAVTAREEAMATTATGGPASATARSEAPGEMADETIRVYWQPGCSSCLRAKEFLTEHGVPFRSIDVLADPQGFRDLQALGVRMIPLVVKGRDWVSGQILSDVARIAGIEYGRKMLPVEDLKVRIDTILAAALRHSAQLPDDEAVLSTMLPNRPRSFRDLACHIFMIVAAFVAETGGDPLTEEKYLAPAPDGVRRPAEIVAFGEAVRDRFEAWWAEGIRTGGHDFARPAKVYYGKQTLHDFMERTAWHSGQHTRQLALVLEKLGIAPERKLTDADFAGLPMLKNVWDDEKRWD
jgi:glutaredoxin